MNSFSLLLLIAALSFSPGIYSQEVNGRKSQIKFKFGPSKNFLFGNGREQYAYKLEQTNLTSGSIGMEFQRTINGKYSWCAGFSYDGQNGEIDLNRSNFQTVSGAEATGISLDNFRFYFGINKNLNQNPTKIYLSLNAGTGLALIPGDGSGSGTNKTDEGITKNNEIFKSQYHNWIVTQGYFRVVSSPTNIKIAPLLFFGSRLNSTTKKGKPGIGLEFLVNYNFLKYGDYVVLYSLNGQNREDIFRAKSINLMANLMIPLVSFGYKGKRGQ